MVASDEVAYTTPETAITAGIYLIASFGRNHRGEHKGKFWFSFDFFARNVLKILFENINIVSLQNGFYDVRCHNSKQCPQRILLLRGTIYVQTCK